MSNTKLKKVMVAACIFLLQPMMNPGSAAFAKRRTPPKAYSFIAEGGKASQGECDGERKIPRLKRLKELSKASSYMGSELQSPEIKGKIDGEMWKHFFRVKASCNTVLAKTPSSVNEALTSAKPELPAEEDIEDTDTNEQTDGPTENQTENTPDPE
ncbi:hypothetical protein EZJ49_08035 [Bdellovibrio bacteriovorus]|uniref:hypothetical protein n=1 Tax=Bdellovibrio bacteriovorus TaxID=959 RepID=UPI0021D091FC|nr:hypothetical protein [Bdellovibrio bacteriovorus]UXR66198.1 hypothetical protein EZJ49_08035 [Bdellovibrio bacteriovorus]